MKVPGPDHPISIARNQKRVRVTFAGTVIADTTQALTLKEASYPAVHYIPRADANMNLLKPTAHTSHCPYKGDASYFSIEAGGRTRGKRGVELPAAVSRRWRRSRTTWLLSQTASTRSKKASASAAL